MPLLEIVLSFAVFTVLQALFVNGLHEATKPGMILCNLAKKLDRKIKNEWIKKPLWKCIQCSGSVWGAFTFWPPVLYYYGFYGIEIFVFIVDVVIVSWLNLYFFKKL